MSIPVLSRRRFVAGSCAASVGALLAGRDVVAGIDGAPATSNAAQPIGYLNAGSLGRSPEAVVAAQIDAIRRLQADPMSAYGALGAEAEAARAKCAELLACDVVGLAIATSTTEGMNLVAGACELVPGDRVLTTDQEHA